MEEQIKELFSFVKDDREDVRKLAVSNVLAITKTSDLYPFFHLNEGAIVKDLMGLINDHPLIAHDSISALVNLSSHEPFIQYLNDDAFIYKLVLTIILPKSILADLCCMLLNNMTKCQPLAQSLIPTTTSPRTSHLDNLLEIFIRGSTKTYNPSASYHFLSGVFANISVSTRGAQCFRDKSNVDGVVRLAKVLPFIEHQDAIRRGGVVATVKNCCFEVVEGSEGVLSEELNLAAYVLLPLCGNEDFDEDIRLMLVETLLLLTQTRPGRDHLRAKRAYPVIKRLHPWERDPEVKDRCERLADMLARDEADGGGGVDVKDDDKVKEVKESMMKEEGVPVLEKEVIEEEEEDVGVMRRLV
ncbi:hypothetical protein BC829DRAFT_384299 [Chytridium lagenaria]|nr:hypothetical protein BC829DRAFT_384299 [Chytridium lagenaria]